MNDECKSIAALARLAVEMPVGDSEGEIAFFINTRKSGYSSLGRPAANTGGQAVVTETRVPIGKLDSLISSSDIDVVKIDVEGAEPEFDGIAQCSSMHPE